MKLKNFTSISERQKHLLKLGVYVLLFILLTAYYAVAADNNRYILFKVIDKNSEKNINSASITINKSVFTTSGPSGFFNVDTKSEQLKKFDFLDVAAQKDGYYDSSVAVSLKNPKIMQPVKVYMVQKMSELTGRIVGCWYDSTGHHYDNYRGEEVSVNGESLSHQMIMYKFTADKDGYFKIDHLPLGTYEIMIRHKPWPIHIGQPGMVIEHDFVVRSCNRDEFHKKTGETFKNNGELKNLKINIQNNSSDKADSKAGQVDQLKLKLKDNLKSK